MYVELHKMLFLVGFSRKLCTLQTGQVMDQKVTVYIQLGAMNGNISDGGKIIALSKQLQIQYKQYQPHHLKDIISTII